MLVLSIYLITELRNLKGASKLKDSVFYDDFYFDDEYRHFMRYNLLYRSLKKTDEEMGRGRGCLLCYEGFGLYGDERDKKILEEHWFWHVISEFMHQELAEWPLLNIFRPAHKML